MIAFVSESTRLVYNMNLRDVQRKHVANNVNMFKCKGTVTKWPIQKHAKQQDVTDV